jgi:hypothetical protein
MSKHTYLPILLIVLLASTLTGLSSCDDTPPKTAQELVTEQLTAGPWRLETVTIEGEDGAQLFQNFGLTFTETGYTSTGTTPVWKRAGTWTFLNEEATRINRDNEVDIDIVSIDDTTLKLTLTWNQETFEGGRTKSLRGKHEFTLRR